MTHLCSVTGVALLLIGLVNATTLIAQESRNPLVVPPVSSSSEDSSSIRFTEHPRLIVSVLPEESLAEGVFEQGQVVITIRIVSKFPFDALNVDFPAIEGVEQIELALPRTRKVSSYAGEGFVHERSFALFALTPGTLNIPAVTAEGLLAIGDKRQIGFDEQFPGFNITVNSKPPSYDDDWWMVSSNVDLKESWSKPLEELHEGDIVTRTIMLRVDGVNARRLPELEHGRTRGIAVRELDNSVKTTKSTQGLTAILTKSWSLKIEGSNVVYISPVGVAFWDSVAQKRKKVAVAGHRIEPLAADSELIAKRLLEEATKKRQAAYTLTLTLLLMVMIPAVALLVYCLAFVLSISKDFQFSHKFINAGNKHKAYRVWLDWSLSQEFQSSTQWHVLSRQIQQTVFSDADSVTSVHSLDRRSAVRQALRCARRNRLKNLREKFRMVGNFIFGQRNALQKS